MEQLVGLLSEAADQMNGKDTSDYGDLLTLDTKFVLNHANEDGIGLKGQLLFAGPTLQDIRNQGSQLWEDKDDDDLFFVIAIKTKGDPQETIDGIKQIIQDFGIPIEDMAAQFGDLKFHAGDGEALIGFKAQDNPYTEMLNKVLLQSKVFGDGSTDVEGSFSIHLGSTFNDMLDDAPLFKHLAKSLLIEFKGNLHEATRSNILEVLESKKEELGPLLSAAHAIFLVKNIRSNIEVDTTEEMLETLEASCNEGFPMAAFSLRQVFALVKQAGLPLDMIRPILDLVQSSSAGEIEISAYAQAGIRFTLNTPGIDEAVGAFLED